MYADLRATFDDAVPQAYLATVLTMRALEKLPNNNSWPYDFMEPGVPAAPLWYLGLSAAHVAFFFVCYGLSLLKRWLCRSTFAHGAGGGYSLLDGTATTASISRFTSASTAGYGTNPTFQAPGKVIGWDRALGAQDGSDETVSLLSAPANGILGARGRGAGNGLNQTAHTSSLDPGYGVVGADIGADTRNGGVGDADPSYMEPAVTAADASIGDGLPEELYVDTVASHLGAGSGSSATPSTGGDSGGGADYRIATTAGTASGRAGVGADYRLVAATGVTEDGERIGGRPASTDSAGYLQPAVAAAVTSTASRDSTDEAGYQVPAIARGTAPGSQRPASTDDDGYAIVP